ncbi:zinc finger protein 366-like [Cydia fagiglandana]|uniref:zinc finger protein 366-like n=1 Tax=Cydia fagiglandana TaxID=1458189 RepID=UPI002FEE0706
MDSAEVEVFVERLDSDIIDEHLRTSTSFLHDIMTQDQVNTEQKELESHKPEKKALIKRLNKRVSIQKHTCSFCGKIYKTRSTLHNHVLLEHTDTVKSKCDKCDKIYPSRLSLEKHERYMHLRHRCPVCYKTFKDPQSLSRHCEECKMVKIACEICGNIYASLVSLRNHVKYMHSSRTGHWCTLCRREFVSEANLINHRNTVHPAGATDCSCGRQFPSLARLRSHELYKHSPVSHKCRYCHKAFATETRLQGHLARLH